MTQMHLGMCREKQRILSKVSEKFLDKLKKNIYILLFLELLVKEPKLRMTATEAQGHRWVRKDFDVQDGPKYKVQTLKLRR